ncbi:hypothetical protein, partial [uncultured Oscillibacter sp.]|uniref:hypothetical protein n=1 Tax=uncultured Oscillibacter sp. TaxID=876091 RepID=UPI0026702B64
ERSGVSSGPGFHSGNQGASKVPKVLRNIREAVQVLVQDAQVLCFQDFSRLVKEAMACGMDQE